MASSTHTQFPLVFSRHPTTHKLGQDVVNLDCTDTLWKWKNECGLDGIDCRPFSNTSLGFRCPVGSKGAKSYLDPFGSSMNKISFKSWLMSIQTGSPDFLIHAINPARNGIRPRRHVRCWKNLVLSSTLTNLSRLSQELGKAQFEHWACFLVKTSDDNVQRLVDTK